MDIQGEIKKLLQSRPNTQIYDDLLKNLGSFSEGQLNMVLQILQKGAGLDTQKSILKDIENSITAIELLPLKIKTGPSF